MIGHVLRASALLLVGAVVLLVACEEAAKPSTAAAPTHAAPSASPATQCVPNVAIHASSAGGAIQGAIKDHVLYWDGARSNVECLPTGQNRQRLNRVGNTESATTTYRVIRVHRTAGARYYMLKYIDGETVCIIDVAGACDRLLSDLGDYDVETLPSGVPTIGEGTPDPPAPPPNTPNPPAPGTPNPPTPPNPAPKAPAGPIIPEGLQDLRLGLLLGTGNPLGTDWASRIQVACARLATQAERDTGSDYCIEEGITLTVTKNDPNGHLSTVRISSSGPATIVVYGVKSTWNTSLDPPAHSPVRIDFTATNADGLQASSWLQVAVNGAPQVGETAPPATFVTVADGESKIVIRDLASFYTDPEGDAVSVLDDVDVWPKLGAAAIDSSGHLVLTPINSGEATIRYYVKSSFDFDGYTHEQGLKGRVAVTINPPATPSG